MSGSPRTTTKRSPSSACTQSSTRCCKKCSASCRPSLPPPCSTSSTPGPTGILTDPPVASRPGTAGPSDCGLAVMRHDTHDRLQVIGRVGAELKGDGHVPGRTGDDQLEEVAVADDEVAQPAAVDVAALGGQGEQGGVDQELLVPVAVAAGGVVQIRPRSQLHLLTVSGRDVANVRRDREDIIMQIAHRLPSGGPLGRRCWGCGAGMAGPAAPNTIICVPPATRPMKRLLQIVGGQVEGDRKSTRLNSSHMSISYAVFCLKKKK